MITTMSVSGVREELVATLEEILGLQRRLVSSARNPKVPAPELVAQVAVLERLDDRRDDLLAELRREASNDLRAARPGRPVREVVLDMLRELRWPQNAGFLEEYLWAAHQLQVDSRAFAPLRRDERRSWDRAPGARGAYVAPALQEDGSPNPRWLTSSAWDLERRIVTSEGTEKMLDLQKILSLVGRSGTGADVARARRPSDALLERYAMQFFEVEPLSPSADADEALAWRLRVRSLANAQISELRSADDPARLQIAAALADRPERDRIWGRDRTTN
jgi:hypothetical protein